jgi:putative pyruvate formate lyase activating enzyme
MELRQHLRDADERPEWEKYRSFERQRDRWNSMTDYPSYLKLHASASCQRIAAARERMAACDICPRLCGVTACARAGLLPRRRPGPRGRVERPPLGRAAHQRARGSGTSFFSTVRRDASSAKLPISQLGVGHDADAKSLAGMMLEAAKARLPNINFVKHSHYVPQCVEACPCHRGRPAIPAL